MTIIKVFRLFHFKAFLQSCCTLASFLCASRLYVLRFIVFFLFFHVQFYSRLYWRLFKKKPFCLYRNVSIAAPVANICKYVFITKMYSLCAKSVPKFCVDTKKASGKASIFNYFHACNVYVSSFKVYWGHSPSAQTTSQHHFTVFPSSPVSSRERCYDYSWRYVIVMLPPYPQHSCTFESSTIPPTCSIETKYSKDR